MLVPEKVRCPSCQHPIKFLFSPQKKKSPRYCLGLNRVPCVHKVQLKPLSHPGPMQGMSVIFHNMAGTSLSLFRQFTAPTDTWTSHASFYVAASSIYSDCDTWLPLSHNIYRFGRNFLDNPITNILIFKKLCCFINFFLVTVWPFRTGFVAFYRKKKPLWQLQNIEIYMLLSSVSLLYFVGANGA